MACSGQYLGGCCGQVEGAASIELHYRVYGGSVFNAADHSIGRAAFDARADYLPVNPSRPNERGRFIFMYRGGPDRDSEYTFSTNASPVEGYLSRDTGVTSTSWVEYIFNKAIFYGVSGYCAADYVFGLDNIGTWTRLSCARFTVVGTVELDAPRRLAALAGAGALTVATSYLFNPPGPSTFEPGTGARCCT